MGFIVTLILLVGGWFFGRMAEKKHERSLFLREHALRNQTVITHKRVPAGWQVSGATFVSGNVVISLDYFKRFMASLRTLVGGNVPGFESLLQRGRREAILRMQEDARQRGLNAIINVRLETSTLASASRGIGGTSGVEVLAYGTALRREEDGAQVAAHQAEDSTRQTGMSGRDLYCSPP